jgi:hypothetical protein
MFHHKLVLITRVAQLELNRTPANPYECLIPVPPNFGGLEPECPMQITEFRASGADIYGTLLHRIWGFLNHV